MYVVCIDVLSFSRRASKEAEQKIFSCRKTASAQHNRSLLLQKVKLPWLQHHSVTQWKWSELILRERHGTPMCPTWAEFTLDNFFGSFSNALCCMLKKLRYKFNALVLFLTVLKAWQEWWGRTSPADICFSTELLCMMQWHTSASDQLPPLWWKYVNLQFLPLCNSPTERASFSTSAPYFEQLLLLFFFFFATNCLRHLYSIM